MAMSWRTASYFSSRPTTATKPSRNPTATPLQLRAAIADNERYWMKHGQAGAPAQTEGRIPQKNAYLLAAVRSLETSCEALCAAVRVAARPVHRPRVALSCLGS